MHLTFNSICRSAGCVPDSRLYGTFDVHYWKDEPKTGYTLRYYVGTLTSTYIHYNDDGSVQCEDTHVLTEQNGMDGWYEFYEVVW